MPILGPSNSGFKEIDQYAQMPFYVVLRSTTVGYKGSMGFTVLCGSFWLVVVPDKLLKIEKFHFTSYNFVWQKNLHVKGIYFLAAFGCKNVKTMMAGTKFSDYLGQRWAISQNDNYFHSKIKSIGYTETNYLHKYKNQISYFLLLTLRLFYALLKKGETKTFFPLLIFISCPFVNDKKLL